MTNRVTLSAADAAYLDAYAHRAGLGTRSEAARVAIGHLRSEELGTAYETAWTEWVASGDAAFWAAVDDPSGG